MQKLLFLHLTTPDLTSRVVAWAMFDPSVSEDAVQMQSGDQDEPPYGSVLDAMRDNWTVLQTPRLPDNPTDFQTGHLLYEYVLQKFD